MAKNIIIFSGKQYSGKDTVAKILLENMPNFKRCAMGDIIKLEYGKQHNLTYKEIEQNKSQYRAGLIELGNYGRSVSQNYWLDKIISSDGNIIVTDVRVPFEYETFKTAGAITIRVEATRETRLSRGKLIGEDDITETGLDNIKFWDFIIENNGTYEELKTKSLDLIEKLSELIK